MIEGLVLGVLLSFGATFALNVAAFAAAVRHLRRRGWRDRRHRRPWIRRMGPSAPNLIVYGETDEQAAERLTWGVTYPDEPTDRRSW
jgi:hypothetical protein